MTKPQYEQLQFHISDLDRIKIPTFQRGIVWNSKAQQDFIQTLSKGLPFGTILVHPSSSNVDSELQLLDGQQRLSTLKKYKEDKLQYWRPLNKTVYDEHYAAALNFFNDSQTAKASFDPESYDPTATLTEKQFDELIKDRDKRQKWINALVKEGQRNGAYEIFKTIDEKLKEFVDLDDLIVYALKFTGDEQLLPTVFENLNKGGVPLSKYEIFSAAWAHTEIQLAEAGFSKLQDRILGKVIDYYTDLADNAEFELLDYSADELIQKRVITLAELGRAIGAYIQEALPALAAGTDKTANELGFGVLAIGANVDNRNLNALVNEMDFITKNLETILTKIDRICVSLQKTFDKLLKVMKSGKKGQYATGITTSFKTLSYFADLWNKESDADFTTVLKNIPAAYVYDYLTNSWGSHGDQRLYDYYPGASRTYATPITYGQFMDAYNQWLADATPGINFAKDIKALVTIHANLTYLANAIPDGINYELEHITAKKIISDSPVAKQILGGSIGNCMYLPKPDNNKKKYKNLYEVNDTGKYSWLIANSEYPSIEDLNTINDAILAEQPEEANVLIRSRAEKVGESLIKHLLRTGPC